MMGIKVIVETKSLSVYHTEAETIEGALEAYNEGKGDWGKEELIDTNPQSVELKDFTRIMIENIEAGEDFDTHRSEPQVGETWQHCKGHTYRIESLIFGADEAFESHEDKRCVVYRNLGPLRLSQEWEPSVFVRSMRDFMGLHSSGAARFVKLRDADDRDAA